MCKDETVKLIKKDFSAQDVMAKMRCVKPTVDKIVDAGNVNDQATMICTVVDHPTLVAAHALGILSTKRQMIGKYSN